ncbi:MAG: DUF5676 family membrane protein [Candidatus Levybacteria bacterium]|nr:DUF5676 family membrane protein [Candidatus Levybacteria bacterium]
MLNAKSFANAATAVTAVFYVVCVLLVYVMPDFIFGIVKSWFHSINIESVRATVMPDLAANLWGLVSLCAVTWVTVYATIWLYNRWAK